MVLMETERLFVRQWVPDDWKRFRPLGTDPRVPEYRKALTARIF